MCNVFQENFKRREFQRFDVGVHVNRVHRICHVVKALNFCIVAFAFQRKIYVVSRNFAAIIHVDTRIAEFLSVEFGVLYRQIRIHAQVSERIIDCHGAVDSAAGEVFHLYGFQKFFNFKALERSTNFFLAHTFQSQCLFAVRQSPIVNQDTFGGIINFVVRAEAPRVVVQRDIFGKTNAVFIIFRLCKCRQIQTCRTRRIDVYQVGFKYTVVHAAL